jgi:hypothetical protein
MNFTTSTQIARKWSKAFAITDYAIVLNNNKNIGLIVWSKFAEALLDSWILQQLREELWEANDKETRDIVKKSKMWNYSKSISLDDYRAKYGV